MKKMLLIVVAVALLVPVAVADTFTLASYSVSLRTNDPGLVLNWTPALATPTSFNLNPGQNSGWFNVFDLWTNETSVNSDDQTAYPISVTFNFSQPLVSAVVGGETNGGSLFGIVQAGVLTWNDPVAVFFGNGGRFSLYLQDAYFNGGLFGLKDGEKHGANVMAKIKYNQGPDPIPEPGTMLLLGSGLAAASAKLRKKR